MVIAMEDHIDFTLLLDMLVGAASGASIFFHRLRLMEAHGTFVDEKCQLYKVSS